MSAITIGGGRGGIGKGKSFFGEGKMKKPVLHSVIYLIPRHSTKNATSLRLLILAAMAIGIGYFAQAGLTDGLVAHWTFDETSGSTAYDSVGSQNGTLMNGPVRTTGIIGGALDFDGVNDYVNFGDILDSQLRNSFTIGLWVKLEQGALERNRLNYVFWKSDDRPGIVIQRSGNVSFKQWYDGTGHAVASTQPLQENTWHYISYVRNGSQVAGYIDGKCVATMPYYLYSPGGTLQIAADTGSRCFQGMIDDVRIYDRALSKEEISLLAVPEPASLALLALGGLVIRKRK